MPITQGTNNQLASLILASGGASALSGTSTLTNICEVLANVSQPDGMGGATDNWVVIGTYPCAITPKTPIMEREEADKVTAVGIYDFQLPSSAIVDPGDRLRFDGILYEVQDRDSALPGVAIIHVRARRVE